MATSMFPSFCFNPSSFAGLIPKLTSTTSFSPPLSCSILTGYNGISLHPSFLSSRTNAKFDKFQGDADDDDDDDVITPSTSNSVLVADTVNLENQVGEEDIEEDDSCLPSNLEGAVRQSGEAAASFVTSGGMRGIVELLIPQLTFLDDEGAQAELWQLSRVFLETIMKETGYEKVKAIYPDAGAAALLKYQWTDAAFEFASLSDRKPVSREDELVVMIVPDFQMLEYVERIAAALSDDSPRPLIMWNPRLISAEVGVGFNVRNLKRFFLRTFTTVYSMKPLPSGAVFRCYPGSWKVFYDDKDRPNRYLLAKELIGRPDAEDLEIIFGDVEEKSKSGGPSLFSKAAGIFSSINRFMKAM